MKKFGIVIISLLFIVACTLSGCAGFYVNKTKYYNEVIATVGDAKITRFDLLSAYNSYGSTYFLQQSQSEEEALNSTLDLLINRTALYLYAKNDANKRFTPNEFQVNQLIEEIFDSTDNNMDTYLETAEIILNVKPLSTQDPEQASTDNSTAYKRENYLKRADLERITNEDGSESYKIVYLDDSINTPTEVSDPIISKHLLTRYADSDATLNQTTSEIRTKYLQHFYSNLVNTYGKNAKAVYNKVIEMRTNDLINYEYYLRDENNKPYNKITNDLLNRYFKRVFESGIEGLYLTNVQTNFLKTEQLSLTSLIDAYNMQVLKDKIVYGNNIESYKSAMTGISTNGDTIFYHPTIQDSTNTQKSTRFGYFIHLLISFTEDDKTILNSYKDMDVNDPDYDRKDDLYEEYLSNIKVTPRNPETGLEEDYSDDIQTIMNEYASILKLKDDDNSYDKRLNAFLDLIYKYSGDPGLLSGGMPYVVGTNGNSQMVEEFNDEAIALMEGTRGNKLSSTLLDGNMTEWDPASDTKFSDLCISTHGIHLLFYIGDVNKFDNNDLPVTINLDDNDKEFNLYRRIVNPLTNKTYFDLMFDKVYPANSDNAFTSNNGYSSYETNLAALSKKTHKVVKYTDKIKSTKTTI